MIPVAVSLIPEVISRKIQVKFVIILLKIILQNMPFAVLTAPGIAKQDIENIKTIMVRRNANEIIVTLLSNK